MEQKQQSSISEEQIREKIEEMGGFEKLAQEEEFFKCERVWWEAPTEALKSIKDPSPEVKTALEICMAVLEYSKGNFGYQPKDLSVRILSSNMRRVIKTSLEERVKQKAKNALAGKASAEKRKKASAEESQYKPAQENTSQQESAREDTSQHVLPQENTSQQESTRANHTTITEQNRTETETEEEPKERKKYKSTTTNNSSSGKISLSVSKAIEILERYNVKNYGFAANVLMNDRKETGLTPEEEVLAVALYFLTGTIKSNVSRITNLMDEAVSKGARERDTIKEVHNLAIQASGQEGDFKDRQKCQVLTGTIVNRLKDLVEKQSRRAAQEQSPVEETQPSLATPQQQAATQAKFSVGQQSQLSLSVSKTIELITRNGGETYRKAFATIKEHGGNQDVQKTIAALYFLTGKSQPEVSEITGLIDEVVNTGARKEENILKEVFDMAIDVSNGCLFDGRNGCRETADKIKNYLKGLLAKPQSSTSPYIDPNNPF